MAEFGPLRSKSSRKPWPQCPDVVVYRCNHCGKVYQGLDYDAPDQEPSCCGEPMERLNPVNIEDVVPEINMDYKIVGSWNNNAVQVFWDIKQPEDTPEWILLKTYTGGYMKYVTPNKKPPLVFPMSDEDAYQYCDKDPCEQCIFRCKNGFMIYVYIKTRGLLLQIPMDKIKKSKISNN